MDKHTLLNLRKFLVPEIVSGRGALELAGQHAKNLGGNRVLVVTDPGVQAAGWSDKVEFSLSRMGIDPVTFTDLSCNPRDGEVMDGAAYSLDSGCDLIIAVGGGSVMDCAKGIGVVLGNGGNILDYEGVGMVPNPGPPLIFIPTTAGTSADVSQFAIITDTRRRVKIAIVSKMVIPDISLIDPATTHTMDPELTASTGMDALCHAFEAFVSTASSSLTDMSALTAVQLIQTHLFNAFSHPDDMAARDGMMTASLMAGLAFSNASLGMVHAMAHSLGGANDLAHGECNALLLEKVIDYNYDAIPEKYDQLGEAMGLDVSGIAPEKRAAAVSGVVSDLRQRLGIHQRLSDMGIDRSDLSELAGFAVLDPCLATNPKPATEHDIENVYEQIWV